MDNMRHNPLQFLGVFRVKPKMPELILINPRRQDQGEHGCGGREGDQIVLKPETASHSTRTGEARRYLSI